MSFCYHLKANSFPLMRWAPLSCLSLMFSLSAQADALDNAREIEHQTNQNAVEMQSKIDQNSDQRLDLQTKIEQIKEQIENQTIYQEHLASLVENQTQELKKSDRELSQINQTREGIVPLMYKMLAGLEDMQAQGIPLKNKIRQKRLDDLKHLMTRADISEGEKFRRLLEAYQIEIDYGNKVSRYQDEIKLADGDVREVELLSVGKVALIARSQDHQTQWLWSQEEQAWQPLPSEQIASINQAFDVASGKSAPELIQVPISAQLVTQSESLAQTQALDKLSLNLTSKNEAIDDKDLENQTLNQKRVETQEEQGTTEQDKAASAEETHHE